MKQTTLKQVATITSGHPFRGKIAEMANGGVSVVQMKDVTAGTGVDWVSCTQTKIPGKRQPDWLTPGDILFTARGSNNCSAMVRNIPAGRNAVAAPHFFVIQCRREDVLPEYLVWFLNQEPCQRYFKREAEGSVTKSLKRASLEEAPIVVPPLAKQQAIIGMAKTLREEQQLISQLICNGEALMKVIANDLLNNH